MAFCSSCYYSFSLLSSTFCLWTISSYFLSNFLFNSIRFCCSRFTAFCYSSKTRVSSLVFSEYLSSCLVSKRAAFSRAIYFYCASRVLRISIYFSYSHLICSYSAFSFCFSSFSLISRRWILDILRPFVGEKTESSWSENAKSLNSSYSTRRSSDCFLSSSSYFHCSLLMSSFYLSCSNI